MYCDVLVTELFATSPRKKRLRPAQKTESMKKEKLKAAQFTSSEKLPTLRARAKISISKLLETPKMKTPIVPTERKGFLQQSVSEGCTLFFMHIPEKIQ